MADEERADSNREGKGGGDASDGKPSLPAPAPSRKAWGEPLAKLDRHWTTLESRLCAGVLIAEVATLVFWISIRALSATGRAGPGMVFRALATALVLGLISHFVASRWPRAATAVFLGVVPYLVTRKAASRAVVVTASVLVGFALGMRWGDAGSAYFANVFAWLQNASILVFFGGASEVAKRFTLWLALLGASLATAQGKHINVDVVMRFLSPRARVPVTVVGWIAAAIVAVSASWGFFDYVAVEEMRAPPTVPCPHDETKRCNAPASSKIDKVISSTGRNLFLAGRQLSLDLRSLPKVVVGTPYNQWMTPREWNAWLRGGGWEKRFNPEDVEAFVLPEDGSIEFRNPSVTAIPGGTEAIPKLLVPVLNLVFSFGLLVIGVRFLLRSLLAISGWVSVDPGAAHGEGEEDAERAEVSSAAIKEARS